MFIKFQKKRISELHQIYYLLPNQNYLKNILDICFYSLILLVGAILSDIELQLE